MSCTLLRSCTFGLLRPAGLCLAGSTACPTRSSSAVDGGSDAASCTCLPIYGGGGGDCGCHEQVWGCMERPQRQVVCDVPPVCWTTAIDPQTGCDRPVDDPRCTDSCTVVDPPWTRCEAQRIGQHCTHGGGECGEGMTCLLTDADKGGICACACTPDDRLTPLVNEDTCPDLSANVCGTVGLSDGSKLHLCFRKCEPTLGANSCVPPLTCALRFGSWVGLPTVALCASFGCQSDADCPVFTTRACQPSAFDGGSCSTGERCQAVSADGKQGLRARAGACDKPSGLCAPRQQNVTRGAHVGDPCQADSDCDGNQRCERERDLALVAKPAGAPCFRDSDCCSSQCTGGKCAPGLCPLHARNGYCVVEGCAFPPLTAYTCPEGSRCNPRYPAGLCQRSCDLQDAKSCRGFAGDRLGDYECRDLSAPGVWPASEGPVCDFGDGLRCAALAPLGCADVGLAGNATQMTCRNLEGRALADPRAPDGLCLDDTASGQ